MTTLLAFVVALGLLITVHEYGHYRVAVACGVKVLRFSIGFGRPLLRWRRGPDDTEFVIAAFPLGGYVRMLDQREAPVAPDELHRAFDQQPLRARAAIVAAGPLANLALAVLLYATVNWLGVEEPAPVLSAPPAGSVLARAGLVGGERVLEGGVAGVAPNPLTGYDDLRWLLTQAALDGQDVRLRFAPREGASPREVTVGTGVIGARDADAQLLERIGLLGPWTAPLIGDLVEGGPADRAGLRKGDRVLRVGAEPVADGRHLRGLIRASVRDGQALAQVWQVSRGDAVFELTVRPDLLREGAASIGRIGAYVGSTPAMVTVDYGLFDGLGNGALRTWEVAGLSLRMMGRMLIGEASLKNLSGPLTIAEYAGKSAGMGLVAYLSFLALISVSLGVLNLLPLPVLDGGHLMYYLWEGIAGRSPSLAWQERLQRAGFAALIALMAVALFNDVSRLLG